MSLTIIGIDPGLVHTGCVAMTFQDNGLLSVGSQVFDGKDLAGVVDFTKQRSPHAKTFIEAYRPRGNVFAQDKDMRKLVYDVAAMTKGKILDNTGVKAVVSQQLMELFNVWQFAQKSHHQDLRSAARIALYGALKDSSMNQVLFDYAFKRLGL